MTEEELLKAIDQAVLRAIDDAFSRMAKKERRPLPPVFLTMTEAMELLSCSRKEIRAFIDNGSIKTKRFGKKELIPLAQIIRMSDVEQLPLMLGEIPTMLTYRQAAKRLGVSLSTLKRMVFNQEIAATRVSHRPRIASTEVARIAGKSMNGMRPRKPKAPTPYNVDAEAKELDAWLKKKARS